MFGRAYGAIGFLAAVICPLPSSALPSQVMLPSDLAVKVAREAIQQCRQKGYGVTAVVMNSEGNVIVQIRGDGARVHTVATARAKAYSAITLAAIHNLQRTSELLGSMQSTGAIGIGSWPMPPQPIKDITLFPGGVNLVADGQIIAALGVAGTPDGKIDEKCASQAKDYFEANL